ncbi:UpxY family transcription antiterminator [Fulvivirga lutea]|uniref:Transcription termination/antitermination NusG family protein n=1 Tax=Fulvivirga lutea TaxID=2810512 RepID=A0A974WEF7_9BACT|nr:UpxY family transcription antiterminator [Fulvivirga lutea]QSE96823.1 transcription termination/antitermination NusG family protein [Fulvivirga lutea]
MAWKAIYTKSRHEKKVTKLLESLGIEVYCPLQTIVRQWSDRKKKVSEPVFKSYVFLKCDNELDYTVLNTNGVVSFVKRLGKVALIRDSEISIIREFLGNYENVEIENISEWEIETPVRIKEGPMKGKNGLISHIKGNKAKLIIEEMGIQIVAHVPIMTLAKD